MPGVAAWVALQRMKLAGLRFAQDVDALQRHVGQGEGDLARECGNLRLIDQNARLGEAGGGGDVCRDDDLDAGGDWWSRRLQFHPHRVERRAEQAQHPIVAGIAPGVDEGLHHEAVALDRVGGGKALVPQGAKKGGGKPHRTPREVNAGSRGLITTSGPHSRGFRSIPQKNGVALGVAIQFRP